MTYRPAHSDFALPSLDSLRTVARRHSRVEDEADDLLQDALLEALRAGRGDLSRVENYRWVVGTLKKLGAMSARGAVRRRLREERWSAERADDALAEPLLSWQQHPVLETLPPSLRQVAMLALSGHDRREVAWLLDLTDTALRQRISTLRKRLSTLEALPSSSVAAVADEHGLPLGLIRRALLPVVRASGSVGTHDPDGHLMIIGGGDALRGGEGLAHVSVLGGNISPSTVP